MARFSTITVAFLFLALIAITAAMPVTVRNTGDASKGASANSEPKGSDEPDLNPSPDAGSSGAADSAMEEGDKTKDDKKKDDKKPGHKDDKDGKSHGGKDDKGHSHGDDGPEGSPEGSPEESPEGSPEPVCFPADSSVTTEGGLVKRMEDVNIGDRVMVAPGQFSDVFMFTHKLANVVHDFVTITTSSGNVLSLTKEHYIYANNVLVIAGRVKVGDRVTVADGSESTVKSISVERKRGLFNPQTVHGDIIVNGVRASTYTQNVNPDVAHAILTPMRALYLRLGFKTNVFNRGTAILANLVPYGESVIA